MQIDLWQRRLGWISLVGIVLFSGGMAQSKFAAAEDAAAPPQPPVTADLVFENQNNALPGENAGETRDAQTRRPWRYVQGDQSLVPLALRLSGVTGLENGKFWIGVECREAQPDLRAQLGLDDGQGLVVVHVAEESPAAKAGIKQHDVVVSAGDAKLGRPQDLVKAVEAMDFEYFLCSHGALGKKSDITSNIRYREDLRAAVAKAIAAGQSVEDAQKTVTMDAYKDWEFYEQQRPQNVVGMYRALTAKR
jgi:membrane-associated protease RseP (regulator of RpoE activity)